MVVGLTVATPQGTLELGSAPANAAGPDLRELVLGPEGAFGVITAVKVRLKKLPAEKVYEAWQFASFAEGSDAMRHLAQNGLLPTVLRLSDENETAINLSSQDNVGGQSVGGCLMIVGHEGAEIAGRRALVPEELTSLGGTPPGVQRGRVRLQGLSPVPSLPPSTLILVFPFL